MISDNDRCLHSPITSSRDGHIFQIQYDNQYFWGPYCKIDIKKHFFTFCNFFNKSKITTDRQDSLAVATLGGFPLNIKACLRVF